MPKKQCKNAFWYFMVDWKAREERNGREFPNGFRDVQADPECNNAWRALSPEEKLVYTNKAKDAKYQMNTGKRTGTGESVDLVRLEEQEKEDFRLNMEAHIRHIVSDAKRYNKLASYKFPFIHMNIYYMRQPDNGPVDFCPAEFAIGEFSIEGGIPNHYHEIVRTQIHIGYTRDAMETSSSTHKLHWNLPIGQGDWGLMYYQVKSILESMQVSNELPPMYTQNKYLHMMPSLFRRLAEAVGKSPDMFVVYSLETLFSNILRAVSDQPNANIVDVLAKTEFTKDQFAYIPNIECDYHKIQDGAGRYCSLSIIRQWAYTFCDHCCKPLKVEMVPGVHCPDLDRKPPRYHNSLISLASERSSAFGILSATGVSDAHRIARSERRREDSREDDARQLDIIDHSKLPKNGTAETEPEEIAIALPRDNRRGPVTASQMVMGDNQNAPVMDTNNFPPLGGGGNPMRSQNRQGARSKWAHREPRKSDSDSD